MIPSPAESKRFVRDFDEKLRAWSAADPDRLFDDIGNLVTDKRTLRVAYDRVARAKGAKTAGADGLSCAHVERQVGVDWFIKRLHDDLKAERYKPARCLEVIVTRKDGTSRTLGVPTVRDRTVQRALALVLGPILEPRLHAGSSAYIAGRGPRYALKRIERIAKDPRTGAFVGFDVHRYFDSIGHARLVRQLRRHVSNPRALSLVELVITSGMTGVPGSATVGLIQGGPLSPLLANAYRDSLDGFLATHPHVVGHVAYGDDVRAGVEGDAGVAAAVLADAAAFADEDLGLTFAPDKTRIVERGEPLDFLGGVLAWDQTETKWLPGAKALGSLEHNLRAARSAELGNDDNDNEEKKTQKTKPIDRVLDGFIKYYAQVTDRPKVEALAREALDNTRRED